MKTRSAKRAAALLVCLCAPGLAQSNPGSRTRSVHGIVRGAKGVPVPGADVEMQDMRTKTIRSFFAGQDGGYHFDRLYSNVTYQLRVRYHGRLGSASSVSRFGGRKDVTLNLRAP